MQQIVSRAPLVYDFLRVEGCSADNIHVHKHDLRHNTTWFTLEADKRSSLDLAGYTYLTWTMVICLTIVQQQTVNTSYFNLGVIATVCQACDNFCDSPPSCCSIDDEVNTRPSHSSRCGETAPSHCFWAASLTGWSGPSAQF